MSSINISEIRNRALDAMDDLAFQEFLAEEGILQRRELPTHLRAELEEFSLGKSSQNLAAGLFLDLGPWVVTPRTFSQVVFRSDIDTGINHNIKILVSRLRERFPELRDYLTNFPSFGYSFEVAALNLTFGQAALLHELYKVGSDGIAEFKLRDQLGMYNVTNL